MNKYLRVRNLLTTSNAYQQIRLQGKRRVLNRLYIEIFIEKDKEFICRFDRQSYRDENKNQLELQRNP